jgi:hypothetical protein
MTQYRTVQLSEDVCAQAEQWLNGRFDNIEALIDFLLREIMKDDGSTLDQREEEIVQQRLRDLGYI